MRTYRNLIFTALFLVILLMFSAEVFAGTITVRKDGTGDYYTIPEAVAAASAHDLILVGPGTYAEYVEVSIPLIFLSEDGPTSTILNGENTHRHMTFLDGSVCEIEGFTFRNGHYAGGAGSVYIRLGSVVSMRNCTFEDNVADFDGGAIIANNPGSMLDADRCTFIHNTSTHNGGACLATSGGQANFTNCTFIENSTGPFAGALGCHEADMNVRECLFQGNTSENVAGVIYYYQSTGTIESCTFYGNDSPGGASVVFDECMSTSVTQNIFANDASGFGLQYYAPATGSHSCNIFWNNFDGPIYGESLDPSEMTANPAFCDPESGDFTVANCSSAAPDNNTCGLLIGAFPVACFGGMIIVRQDGTGDYYTIPEAVAVATVCDTILVGPGTYTDPVEVSAALILMSEEGASSTIMDGESSHRHLTFLDGSMCEVEGFTFRNGHYAGGAGSVYIRLGSMVSIRNCTFEDNVADYDGGAIIVNNRGSLLEADKCSFINNMSTHNAGACMAINDGRANISNCVFIRNSTGLYAGALACDHAIMSVSECLFQGNTSNDVAGAIYFYRSTGSIESSTFYANDSPERASAVINQSSSVTATQNIFSSDISGFGLQYIYYTGMHSCNIFWNNAAGALDGDDLDPSEMLMDPLFCDVISDDFTVTYSSPAAPENNACGLLIGAFPAACDQEAVYMNLTCPQDTIIAAFSTVASIQLSGFEITNSAESESLAFNYQLVTPGPAVLVDNGDPASLAGTTPVLAPGESYAPPEAALDVPAIREYVVQEVAYRVSPAAYPGAVDSCITTVTYEPPVPVLVTSFDAMSNQRDVELTWDIVSDEEVEGFRIYRRTEGSRDTELVNADGLLPADTRNYVDKTVQAGRSYVYWLGVVGTEGHEVMSHRVTVKTKAYELALNQNHPNPFNPVTTITFTLPERVHVILSVYDLRGMLIKTLLDQSMESGFQHAVWDGRDDRGNSVASGVYFYRLKAGKTTLIRKMVLVR